MSNKKTIQISSIICTYNRERYIVSALKKLVNQSLNKSDYEIIIINNNSTDNTELLCLDFIARHLETNIKYFVEKKPGLSNARNLGLAKASGKVINYIDDDGMAESNFLENIIKNFDNYPSFDAQGGKVLPIFEGGEPQWMSKPLQRMVSKVDYGNEFKEFSQKKYPVGCNMSFRRKIFKKTGGFNNSLTIRSDDKYIFYRIREVGFKILYSPNVIVNHHIDAYRLTEDFIRNQSVQIGEGEKLRLRKKTGLKLVKHIEYLFKLNAALMIAFVFLLQFKPQKAKYIVMVLWLTYLGYLGIKIPR